MDRDGSVGMTKHAEARHVPAGELRAQIQTLPASPGISAAGKTSRDAVRLTAGERDRLGAALSENYPRTHRPPRRSAPATFCPRWKRCSEATRAGAGSPSAPIQSL